MVVPCSPHVVDLEVCVPGGDSKWVGALFGVHSRAAGPSTSPRRQRPSIASATDRPAESSSARTCRRGEAPRSPLPRAARRSRAIGQNQAKGISVTLSAWRRAKKVRTATRPITVFDGFSNHGPKYFDQGRPGRKISHRPARGGVPAEVLKFKINRPQNGASDRVDPACQGPFFGAAWPPPTPSRQLAPSDLTKSSSAPFFDLYRRSAVRSSACPWIGAAKQKNCRPLAAGAREFRRRRHKARRPTGGGF